MRNETKTTLWVLFIVSLVVAAFAWSNVAHGPPAGSTVWALRVQPLLFARFVATMLLKNRLRKEDLPDHLRELVPRPFECNGLCLGFIMEAIDGRGELHVLFQNRFERACNVELQLVRRHGFSVFDSGLECWTLHIQCEGGAFGIMRVPIPVRRRWQGKRKMFGIMGLVNYPQGRGELLRYRSGRHIGVDRVAGSGIAAKISSAVSERAAARRMAHFRMRYPANVAETLAEGALTQTETLWKPGDEVAEPVRLAA